LADGILADLCRRFGLQPEVEHGLDARYARLFPHGPVVPPVPPEQHNFQYVVQPQREFHAGFVPR
jgi:hypothetical protein